MVMDDNDQAKEDGTEIDNLCRNIRVLVREHTPFVAYVSLLQCAAEIMVRDMVDLTTETAVESFREAIETERAKA